MATKFRKIIRSSLTKGIALSLCAVLVVSLIYFGGQFLLQADRSGIQLIDLRDGDYLHSAGSYYEKQRCVTGYLVSILQLKRDAKDMGRGQYEAQRLLDELQKLDGFLYYATDGTEVISNTGNPDPEYYKGFSSYYLLDEETETHTFFPETRDGVDRSIDFPIEETAEYAAEHSYEPAHRSIKGYVALTNAYIQQRTAEYQAITKKFPGMMTGLAIGFCLLLALIVYLCVAAGRRGDRTDIALSVVDRLWSEVTLAGTIVMPVLTVGMMAAYVDEVYTFYQTLGTEDNQFWMGMIWLGLGIIACAGLLLTMVFLLSLVRKLKAHTFLHGSLCYRLVRKLAELGRHLCGAVGQWGSLSFRVSAAFVGLELAIFLVALLLAGLTGLGLIALVVLNVGGILWLGRKTKLYERIIGVLSEIRRGGAGEKLETTDALLGGLAEQVNAVSDGVQEAVRRETRAERMKAELITNVSHDLKTPLTSIINYADLLIREELSPAAANDYAKIIAQKGEKLKQLTQDLFDISKAQSGNIEVCLEDLDIYLLLRQALAEVEDHMKTAELTVIFSEEEEALRVSGDGRLLSRAVGNLLTNIVKYSMRGTRVYIDVKAEREMAEVIFKNIAGYPMNFAEEEIMERFVRGDSARTTEGSGLGLAIAKEYAAACGGSLSVQVDGDLFKAILRLPCSAE